MCELELECEGAFKVRLRNKDSIWLQWKVIVKVFELGTQVSTLPGHGGGESEGSRDWGRETSWRSVKTEWATNC